MEGIFLGQAVDGVFSIDKTKLTFEHERRTHESHSAIRYSDCDYVLVESDDVIKTNDELLKLREQVAKLEAELMEIKTARTLREAYIAGVEKGCEGLREERDRWKNRWNSVVTDIGESLKANGITFVLKEIDGEGNWDVVIDIPELNEAKAKVADLEKKLADSKSKEEYWRDRKEEEENYHHYWLHTYDLAVGLAADEGVRIFITGENKKHNVGVVLVKNEKASDLESQVIQMEDANQKLRQRISAADEEIERIKDRAYWRNTYYSAVEAAKNEGVTIVQQGMDSDHNAALIKVVNHRAANLKKLAEYWDNTYKDIVAAGKKVGVKIEIEGRNSDSNAGNVCVTNEKTIELMVKLNNTKQEYDKKWQAMLDGLKAKGVEVIYMGEEDDKPLIDVKIPEIDILKKELEALKSRTLDNVEIRLSMGDIVWTYLDGVHVSSGISGMISADEISTGTVPKCSSCAHYMHNPSRFAHDWCYMPIPKEGGAGYIRKLNKEEAEGPACADFKARKEPECKDCKYHNTAFWRVSTDGEGMATCKSPKTKYGFCQNNCNGEKACPEFEAKE